MSDPVKIITDVLKLHTPFDQFDIEMDPVGVCGQYHLGATPATCDQQIHYEEWFEHVGVELAKALGLTQEWGVGVIYPPRPDDGYPGAAVICDSYRLREAAENTKHHRYPEDDYSLVSRLVSEWTEAEK